MGKAYSKYQRKVIERYYDQRDVIALNRLQEIVTDLVLAETDAKRKRLWTQAEKAMTNLKVPPALMQHILTSAKPEVLARNVRDWLDEAKRQPRR